MDKRSKGSAKKEDRAHSSWINRTARSSSSTRHRFLHCTSPSPISSQEDRRSLYTSRTSWRFRTPQTVLRYSLGNPRHISTLPVRNRDQPQLSWRAQNDIRKRSWWQFGITSGNFSRTTPRGMLRSHLSMVDRQRGRRPPKETVQE